MSDKKLYSQTHVTLEGMLKRLQSIDNWVSRGCYGPYDLDSWTVNMFSKRIANLIDEIEYSQASLKLGKNGQQK